jgi:phosphoribosylaminoimidazolecarboxamide formyltransferase / IMP cyclohydrolase
VIDQIKIKRALISVYDKEGLLPLAQKLVNLGVEILSTGGTAKFLQEHNLPVTSVADVTGFPEILGGRVKTLHPHIHAGLLAKREDPHQMAEIAAKNIAPIDLVVVNLYPFEKTVAAPDVTLKEAIENIDIGGPCMIRASAKNYFGVTIATSPSQYSLIIDELDRYHGATTLATRQQLSRQAFSRTCEYDAAISSWLYSQDRAEGPFPESMAITLRKKQDLRYGENPHQQAAFYTDGHSGVFGEQLHGKELSFNNIMDVNAAVGLSLEFTEPCAVIVKHNNPCGVAIAETLTQAFDKALQCDRASAYGGIIAFNRAVDAAAADKLAGLFLEVIVAPDFNTDALPTLTAKKNLRLLKWPHPQFQTGDLDVKKVLGGYLVQTVDIEPANAPAGQVVSERAPNEKEWQAMRFGWKVAKWVKSNTILFVAPDRTLGIGAGQMSRVDSSKIAAMKASQAGLDLTGSVAVSDAFFPFRDGLDVLAEAGAVAVIQPGGSIRDNEVIAAANERRMAMVFTGLRHFRH